MTTSHRAAVRWRDAVHVGRQPIHDRTGRIHGYELLFRATAEDLIADPEAVGGGDAATTATILAAFSEFGPGELIGDRPGFVNLTRAFLVGDLPLPFPPGPFVLEVMEDVQADPSVAIGAERLVEQGYKLALDDYMWTPATERLLRLAAIAKVDVLALDWTDVLLTVERCREHGVTLLAEKVEDEAMLRRCLDAGFELFQGYHLGRPETLTASTLSPSQGVALQLVGRLSDPETSMTEIEDVVRHDPALAYRLLRIANSASSGVSREVSSLHDAIVMVGVARLRAWLLLLSLGGSPAAGAALTNALTRAGMCERVSRSCSLGEPETAFTVGLLHGVAEALNLSPTGLLERMPALAPELSQTLFGSPGELRTVLDAVLAYESQNLAALAPSVPVAALVEGYLGALAWTTRTTQPTEGVD